MGEDRAVTENIVDELAWRGLISQSTDLERLRARLDEGPITVYAGFDPTASSLHAGHLVPILTLRRLQRAGHRPILLAGGATGQIGDPRDVGERVMQTPETVAAAAARIREQLARFVDLDGANAAIEENNIAWTGGLSAIDFLRDVGKYFSVNVMLARETVKRRLATDGISYTEFSYMLLQANDYLQLYRRHGCVLEIGGSDQWGNIIAGVDFVRRTESVEVHALTTPLVTDGDGNKIGKSTGGGSLWLDAELTTPYAWYQYFLNAADSVVEDHLKWFTFLGREEIAALVADTQARPHLRNAQRALAAELTTLVHGADATRAVEAASAALFGRGELGGLDEATLAAALRETSIGEFAGLPDATIVDLLVGAGLTPSKGAARRAVGEGGAYVNNVRIDDVDWTPAATDLLHGHWLVVRRGKKSFGGAYIGG